MLIFLVLTLFSLRANAGNLTFSLDKKEFEFDNGLFG